MPTPRFNIEVTCAVSSITRLEAATNIFGHSNQNSLKGTLFTNYSDSKGIVADGPHFIAVVNEWVDDMASDLGIVDPKV